MTKVAKLRLDLVAQIVCSYLWLSRDCVFLCILQHLVAQTLSYHQPVNTEMINTHVCNVVPSFQDDTPYIYTRRHTWAATLTPVTSFFCGKGCLSKGTLRGHMASNVIHDFKCSLCPQQYTYATGLRKHVQYCHKDADGNVPNMPL